MGFPLYFFLSAFEFSGIRTIGKKKKKRTIGKENKGLKTEG